MPIGKGRQWWYQSDMGDLTWEVPLDSAPEVVAIGRNAHGFTPSDRYRLPDLWTFHLYDYEAKLLLDGKPLAIHPRHVGLVPPGTTMEYHYFGISVHVYAHLRLKPGPTRRMAALQDLGDAYDPLYARIYEAIGWLAREPGRVNARLWDALWEVASHTADPTPGMELHRAVRHVSDLIERNLGESLTVGELAQLADVSPNYLARLFQEAYGESVVGYLRRRRMERASHLLQRSTLPIKAIATTVGMPDLQHFNKAIRAEFGVGPREWRNRGPKPNESI
ncbi:AraC family transcriptional regulator [bacterium]|nr:MAG: AraC family transcriptional regulator [bacterium]